MSNQSYSNHIVINADPELVFNAITKEINKWWTELSNKINNVGDKLTVQFEDLTSWEMDVISFSPNHLLEWYVTNANHNLESLSRKDEWKKTNIKWIIEENINGSKVFIIHEGLVPSFECYTICHAGWDHFLKSLRNYLENGKGSPYKKL